MYYIVCGGKIFESQFAEPSQDELQRLADEQDKYVYVIRGEHHGMSAEPSERIENDDEGEAEER